MRPNPLIFALLYSLGLAAFAGCGGKSPGGSPEEVARAFADAMAAGDTAGAAELWSYVSEARNGNPDWDEFPSGQRSQIISKMEDAKAGELKGQTGQFDADMQAGPATVSGTSATVELQGGASGSVVVRLEQADGKWGVAGFGQSQATR
jgi:hypothetical protein